MSEHKTTDIPPLLRAAMDAGRKVAELRAALALAEEEQARAIKAWGDASNAR